MKRHWVVFILPAILMVFIALGGFIYLSQDDTLSNEELQKEVEFTAVFQQQAVTIEWAWPQLPTEGIYGIDYIGLSFDGDPQAVEIGQVTLPVEPEQTYDGFAVENGIIFAFPTEMQEHQSVGTRGQLIQGLPPEVDVENVKVTLLHTWTNHEDLLLEDATFANPQFGQAKNVQHWVKTYSLEDLLEN
ncbi:hypothetical protein [Shouchella hunanensis]|uniref:Uncharacterized protein n=1 Tax=Shouchella hunanensis TaxID=766894 RepID=A0ABY7W8R4_9BACI|nr:hypothetical protein [Shouchella hunanensis]WDF03090.1 hypothetical protein PQ477_16575 [Shouchella hunanensis]